MSITSSYHISRAMDRSQRERQLFFSEQNESMLYGMLSKNFQQRLGALNEKQSSRLERALEHYMSEVFQANVGVPVQVLNKEVLSATASDFNDYIQRQDALNTATPQMFQETSNRFEQLQQDRQRSLEARPSVPEYVQPIQIKEDDSVSALTMFEEAKKRRNMEMTAQAEAQMSKRSATSLQPLYLQDTNERPDPRMMYDRPLDLVIAGQELSGVANANPTVSRAVPGSAVASRGSLQQDIIIKQQDIQAYRETEYNLSLYSADRKWEIEMNESRYNFSVNLYSGNPTNGVSIAPKATARFKNIVRIEFVKAIMPIEYTDMIIRKSNSTTYDSDYYKNIFGYPFVTLHVDELDTNTYGTNNTMDNAFGILQYDANWTDSTDSMGFTSLIPKHMKCQRVYSPTPLSTLNKLTIRLQQPNGELVNSTPDTLDISGVFLSISDTMKAYTATTTTITSSYVDTKGEYIWIDCKKWFSKYQVAAGDRIQIRNLNIVDATATQVDLLRFLQNPNGLMVVGTAAISEDGLQLYDGTNSVGYSRFIIVRGQFHDPTTGSTSVLPFGGQSNNTALSVYLANAKTEFTSGRLINLSHQTQFIFRVVTREYDPTALVRPDNL